MPPIHHVQIPQIRPQAQGSARDCGRDCRQPDPRYHGQRLAGGPSDDSRSPGQRQRHSGPREGPGSEPASATRPSSSAMRSRSAEREAQDTQADASAHAVRGPHEPGPARLGGWRHPAGAGAAGASTVPRRGKATCAALNGIISTGSATRSSSPSRAYGTRSAAWPSARTANAWPALGGLATLVKVWDAQTGQELLSLKGGWTGVAFSPDGKRLACAGSRTTR